MTAQNLSNNGSLSLYLLENNIDLGSTTNSYSFDLNKTLSPDTFTGDITLYSRDHWDLATPDLDKLEALLKSQENIEGTLKSADDQIIIAPL